MNRSLLVAIACVGLWVSGCKDKPAPPPPLAAAPKAVEPAPAVEAPTAAPAPLSWQPLDAPTFTIDVPGTPKMQEGVEKTKAGAVNTRTWSVQTPSAFYAVSIADYPKGMMGNAVPSKVLEGARDGAMANVGGKVDKDFAVFLDAPNKKYPGREFDGTTTAGIKMAARLFLVDDRLYQMISVSPIAAFNAEEFAKFADSFKLKPVAAAPAPAKATKRRK